MTDINERLAADWSAPAMVMPDNPQWAVGRFRSSHSPNQVVLKLSVGAEIERDADHHSFLGWVHAHPLASPAVPSRTTQTLIAALSSRDAAGRAKYGTSLDRTDLSFGDWCQHLIEELLDAAGYAQRMKETWAARTMTVDVKVDASDALAALPQMQEVLKAVDLVLWWDSKLGENSSAAILREAISRLRTATTALELNQAGDPS